MTPTWVFRVFRTAKYQRLYRQTFFNEKDGLFMMPNNRFYKTQIPWRNIFSVSSLCQRQRKFSLSENYPHYNNILIAMKKDAAQPEPISVRLKKVPAKKYWPEILFRENLQKIMWHLFENLDVSLGTTTSCICLLKSQRFAQFLCHLMWSRWLNYLVNDMSVVKNLIRFCFSVPYVLCIEKKCW